MYKLAWCADWMSWSRVRLASNVEDALQQLNCMVGTRECLAMSLYNRHATSFSRSFPRHSNSEMGHF